MKYEKEQFYHALCCTLTSENFMLRAYDAGDYESYAALFFQSEVMESVGGKALEEYGQFDRLLEKQKMKRHHQTHLEFVIMRRDKNQLAGEIGIKFKFYDKGILELSYLLKREFWGKGIMTECVGALLKKIYEIDETIKVQGQCREDNIGSQKVLQKCGFELVGLDVMGEDFYKRFEHVKGCVEYYA